MLLVLYVGRPGRSLRDLGLSRVALPVVAAPYLSLTSVLSAMSAVAARMHSDKTIVHALIQGIRSAAAFSGVLIVPALLALYNQRCPR